MPKDKTGKRGNSKHNPYPTSKPSIAGPSTLSAIPINQPEIPSTSTPSSNKRARRIAKRQSSGGHVDQPLGGGSTENAGPSPKRAKKAGSARTESAATITTVGSASTQDKVGNVGEGSAKAEKSKKKKGNKKQKRASEVNINHQQDEAVVESSIIPVDPVAQQPTTTSSTTEPLEPNSLKAETIADIVFRLTTKTGKERRSKSKPGVSHAVLPNQPIEAPAATEPPIASGSGAAPVEVEEAGKGKKMKKLKDGKSAKLQLELQEAKESAEKERAAWQAEKAEMMMKLKDVEENAEVQMDISRKASEEKDQDIAKNVKILETLREAAMCGVCLDYFKDPHILACGHIACKNCLVTWFRTPTAFLHEIPRLTTPDVPSTRDVSYRTKLCHVCRVPILRRPSRMYHFDSILEPLGINPQLPTLSQDAQSKTDAWQNIFPKERDTYIVHDDNDHIDRCPECHSEIEDDFCNECQIEFSDNGDEDDDDDHNIGSGVNGEILSEGSEIGDGDSALEGTGDDEDDNDNIGLTDEQILARSERRAEIAAEMRAERDIQAHERHIEDRANMLDIEAEAEEDRGSGSGSDGGGGGVFDDDPMVYGTYGDMIDRSREGRAPEGDELYGGRRDGGGGGLYGGDSDDEEEDEDTAQMIAMHNQDFRHRDLYSPDDPMHYASQDEYEDSFIDDDGSEEDEESGSEVVDGGSGEDSLIDVLEKDSDVEEISVDQMRERRLAKFGGNDVAGESARSVSPVVIRSSGTSSRRRVVESSDEE